MPYKDDDKQRKAQAEWARKNRAAKNTSKLDSEVENLLKRGVALPKHPLRQAQAASDMHRIAATPGDLKTTISKTVRGKVFKPDQNTDLIKNMRTNRNMRRTASDTWAAIPRFYDPMEYWDLSGLPWN